MLRVRVRLIECDRSSDDVAERDLVRCVCVEVGVRLLESVSDKVSDSDLSRDRVAVDDVLLETVTSDVDDGVSENVRVGDCVADAVGESTERELERELLSESINESEVETVLVTVLEKDSLCERASNDMVSERLAVGSCVSEGELVGVSVVDRVSVGSFVSESVAVSVLLADLERVKLFVRLRLVLDSETCWDREGVTVTEGSSVTEKDADVDTENDADTSLVRDLEEVSELVSDGVELSDGDCVFSLEGLLLEVRGSEIERVSEIVFDGVTGGVCVLGFDKLLEVEMLSLYVSVGVSVADAD